MRLLIFTQAVDLDNPVLGFFHGWIAALATRVESIQVVCLFEGRHALPKNVSVYSLGKEKGGNKLSYVFRFYSFIFKNHRRYDAVFVHMNQEYVLLGGLFWKLWNKRVYMWRNHHAGTFLTDFSARFCDAVFCTSKFSYTANYRNTKLMPVGVNLELFKKNPAITPAPNSILFLGRISPSKNVHLFIEALSLLKKRRIHYQATICGDPLPMDQRYYDELKKQVEVSGLGAMVVFQGAVPNTEAATIYNAHEYYINLSSSGMYDKTIFEAMMCGALALASNDNLLGKIDSRLVIQSYDPATVAEKMAAVFTLDSAEKEKLQAHEESFAKTQSLSNLSEALIKEMAQGSAQSAGLFRILRFLIAGGLGVLTNVSILYLFTDLFNLYYLYSAIIAFIVASFVSFNLQKRWTFLDNGREGFHGKLTSYYIVAIVGIFINTFLMYAFVTGLGVWHIAAQLISSALIAIMNFFLYKRIFRAA